MADLHDLTALQQGAAVRDREVSPVELCEHYLERIGRLSDEVGAYLTVTADLAMDRARELERDVRTDEPRSPLRGVPVPVKDLNNTRGVRTTYGSAVYADNIAAFDDFVVTRLRAAGTVLLGKTNTPEFGLPCYTENALMAPARSPWGTDLMAGGSSGGAAAAVSAGLAPVAHGNDGGGSVRIPASCCGLVGLKPSRGRVSNGPLKGDVTGLGVEGSLGRTVRDAAALLDAMAGPMPGDPHWAAPLPAGESFLAHCDREPGRLRVGRFSTPVIADAAVDPECLQALDEASRLLESMGHLVEDVESPIGHDTVPLFEQVWSVSATLALVPPGRDDELMPLTRHLRARGAGVSGTEFAAALSQLQILCRAGVARLAAYDVLLTPTLAQLPLPVGAIFDADDPARDFERNKTFTPFTAVFNMTGQPAITLPLHWTDEGIPVGVMLAGPPAGEALLLSLSAAIEATAPWAARRPACW
ncbi:MAG: amidase [Actinomycetota bacterium]|nr:amidase [Actinomycetota bacterium]